jgi:hypothetical protein
MSGIAAIKVGGIRGRWKRKRVGKSKRVKDTQRERERKRERDIRGMQR